MGAIPLGVCKAVLEETMTRLPCNWARQLPPLGVVCPKPMPNQSGMPDFLAFATVLAELWAVNHGLRPVWYPRCQAL